MRARFDTTRLLATTLAALLAAAPAAALAQAPLPPPPGETGLPPPPGEAGLPPPPGEAPLPPPPGETGVPQLRAGDALAEAQTLARDDAQNEGALLWAGVAGIVAGVAGLVGCCFSGNLVLGPLFATALCGSLGCLTVATPAYVMGVEPHLDRVANRDARFQAAYVEEYRSTVKFRRAKYAFIGGAIGTAVMVALGTLVVLAVLSTPTSNGSSGSGQ